MQIIQLSAFGNLVNSSSKVYQYVTYTIGNTMDTPSGGAELPLNVSYAAVQQAGNQVVIFGGVAIENGMNYTNLYYVFNLSASPSISFSLVNTGTLSGTAGNPRSAGLPDNKAVFSGDGMFWIYDGVTGDMVGYRTPNARSYVALCTEGYKIYLVGGIDHQGLGSESNRIDIWDTQTNAWWVRYMAEPRQGAFCEIAANVLGISPGYDANGTALMIGEIWNTYDLSSLVYCTS